MPTQKRRVIYLSDTEWDQVKRRAAKANVSASEFLRDLVAAGAVTQPGFGYSRAAPKPGK